MTAIAAVLRVLRDGPLSASSVGAEVWPGRRGRVIAAQGGGDYAAQMLLGRMRKAGLVQHARSDGSTLWELTPLGRREAAQQ
jgi:hypothetical protein